MKRNNIYLIIAIILILLSIANIILYYSKQPIERDSVETSLIVSNHTGFDLNDTVLKFGKIRRGTSMERNLLIDNSYDFPIIVYLNCSGNITRFLSHPYNITIQSGKTKRIKVIARMPLDEEVGKSYNGKIETIIYAR